jgi:hypothetical protein
MHTLVVVRRDHDHIRAPERGLENASAAGSGELNIAGEERVDASCGAPADKDRFRFDAMLLEEAALFGDPNRAVGRTERPHADAHFIQTPKGCRVNAAQRRKQKNPNNCSSRRFHRFDFRLPQLMDLS